MYSFWKDMYVCKTRKVVGTSHNLAAILDFWYTLTSHETRSTTIRKFDPENIRVAVGILSVCALELEMCLEGISSPWLPADVAEKPLPGEGLTID